MSFITLQEFQSRLWSDNQYMYPELFDYNVFKSRYTTGIFKNDLQFFTTDDFFDQFGNHLEYSKFLKLQKTSRSIITDKFTCT